MQLTAPTKIPKIRKKRTPKHDFKDGLGRVFAHRHANGNGWVADTAQVEEKVYVGARAQVYNYARVRGQVRLEGRARVFGHATLDACNGAIVVKTNAQVYGNCSVRDNVIIGDNARVTGRASISGNSRILGHASVFDSTELFSCVVTGQAQISGSAMLLRSTVVEAIVNGNCTVYDSTINSIATITGFATLIESSVFAHYAQHPVVIRGHVLLAKTRVYCPVLLDDRCMCNSVNFYIALGNNPDTPSVSGNYTIRDRVFHTRDELTQFMQNQDAPAQPAQPVAAAFPTRTLPNDVQVNVRQPVPIAPARGRRVQRLAEVVAV